MENIDRYFKDLRRTHPFSQEDEAKLSIRIQQGDKAALNLLVEGNLRFVVSEARKFIGRGMDLEDLIQEGNFGLIEAAKRFDHSVGFRFITYAVWWIRQSIFAALNNNRLVRLPMNAVGILGQISKATALFRGIEGRDPSDFEIAELTGLNIEDIQMVYQSSLKAASLSKSVGDSEEDGCLEDLIEDKGTKATDSALIHQSLSSDLLSTIAEYLTEREQVVVQYGFGICCEALPDDVVGKRLGVSAERVRQLREASVRKLRKYPAVLKKLSIYLG